MTNADTTTSADHVPTIPDLQVFKDPTPAALAAFAAFVPELEAPGASAGRWHGSEKTPEGNLTFPCFVYSDLMERIHHMAYQNGYISGGFDWPQWSRIWGKVFFDDISLIEFAPPLHLVKLMTSILRKDRFCEGTVEAEFNRGTILALARRAKALDKAALGGTKGVFLGGRSKKRRK